MVKEERIDIRTRIPKYRSVEFKRAYFHELTSRVRRIPLLIRWLLSIDLALIAGFVISGGLYVAGILERNSKLVRLLDLESESNLPTWFSSMQLLLLAVMFALLAHWMRKRSASRAVWIPAFLFLFLSFDEIGMLHEWLGYQLDFFLPAGERANTALYYTGLWGIVIGVPALGCVLLMWRRLRSHFSKPETAMRRIILGSCLLIGGAAGLDFVANFTEGAPLHLHSIQIIAEEGAELFGVTFLCWGALEVIQASGIRIVFGPEAKPVPERSESRGPEFREV